MSHSTSISKTNVTWFEEGMKNLANFKDAADPTTQRIKIISSTNDWPIVLTTPPKSFWKRLCERIYKRKEQRLMYVVNETIKFLKDNQKKLEEGDNLKHLKNFITKLRTVHTLQKKGAQVLSELDKLATDIQKKHEENRENIKKKLEDAIEKAKKDAEQLQTNAKKTVESIVQKQKEAESTSAQTVDHLKKQAKNLISERPGVEESAKETAYKQISEHRIKFNFPVETNFNIKVPMPKEDTVFLINGTKIPTHSVFYPEFIKGNQANLNKDPNDPVKYTFVLDGNTPEFAPKLLIEFIRFIRGADENLSYTVSELIDFCFYAENLKMDGFSSVILTSLVDHFKNHPYTVIVACDRMTQLKYVDSASITTLLNHLKELDVTGLKDVPKRVYTSIAKGLDSIPKKLGLFSANPQYATSQEILVKWKNNNLI